MSAYCQASLAVLCLQLVGAALAHRVLQIECQILLKYSFELLYVQEVVTLQKKYSNIFTAEN